MSNKNKYRLLHQSLFVLAIIAAMSGGRALAQNPYDYAAANTQGQANGVAVPVQAASPFDVSAYPAQGVTNSTQYVTSENVQTIDPTVYGPFILSATSSLKNFSS